MLDEPGLDANSAIGQLHKVTLNETPAALVRDIAHVLEPFDTCFIVAGDESDQRFAERVHERVIRNFLRGFSIFDPHQQGEVQAAAAPRPAAENAMSACMR